MYITYLMAMALCSRLGAEYVAALKETLAYAIRHEQTSGNEVNLPNGTKIWLYLSFPKLPTSSKRRGCTIRVLVDGYRDDKDDLYRMLSGACPVFELFTWRYQCRRALVQDLVNALV